MSPVTISSTSRDFFRQAIANFGGQAVMNVARSEKSHIDHRRWARAWPQLQSAR